MYRFKPFHMTTPLMIVLLCACAHVGPKIKSRSVTYKGTILSKEIMKGDHSTVAKGSTVSFYAENRQVFAIVKLKNISGRHHIHWEWKPPGGGTYTTADYEIGSTAGRYIEEATPYHMISISGESAQHKPGLWEVDIYVDQDHKETRQFWINPGSDPEILPPLSNDNLKASRFGLIIGIEKYKDPDIPPAKFAEADARQMKAYFTNILGIPRRNMKVLSGSDSPTKSSLEGLLTKSLPELVKGGSTLFVYFSGHGFYDIGTNAQYLVPFDGDPGIIEKTGYNLKTFYEALKALKVDEIYLFMDACFSDMAKGGDKPIIEGSKPLGVIPGGDVSFLTSSTKITVFSAASKEQIAHVHESTSHGLFTYFLFTGMKGGADQNRDGRITVEELHDYVTANVSHEALSKNKAQTPTLHRNSNKDRTLTAKNPNPPPGD